MTASPPAAPDSGYSAGSEIDGWKLVFAMLTFGALATSTLWGYWYYHSAPFIPLQVAIAQEFPASAPRVDGGQRRMHKGTEELLWVIMRVKFNPQDEPEKSRMTVDRVVELAKETIDLDGYEQLTVRLFFGDLEREIHKADFEVPLVNE